jgi:hypothetical protein
MLTPEQIDAAKLEAKEKFNAKLRKEAIEAHTKLLAARRAHFFPKRIVFQWPIRFDEWVKTNVCCKTRKS